LKKQSKGFLMAKTNQEQTIIPPELKDVTEEEVIRVADLAWQDIMKKIHKQRGQKTIKKWGYINIPVLYRPGRQMPLTHIPTRGCRSHLNGGCTMCDYGHLDNLTETEQKKQAILALNHIEKSNLKYPELYLFNLTSIGSFFDVGEIQISLRKYIFERIADNRSKSKYIWFITESRLEYINEENVKEMINILGEDINIEIGFGFESSNKLIQEGCINKRFPENYKDKIRLLKSYNIILDCHIIIKPPFLTEMEAIDDTVKSTRYIFDNDLADLAIVMAMNEKPLTLVGKLISKGKYELPSIWSVVEIIKRLGPDICSETRFFGFITNNAEVKTVKGCNECSDKIMPTILNFTGDVKEFHDIIKTADSIDCKCKREWKQKIKFKPKSTLAERIATGIDELAKEYLNKSFKDF